MQAKPTTGFMLRATMLFKHRAWEKSGEADEPRELLDLKALYDLLRETFGEGADAELFNLPAERAERAMMELIFLAEKGEKSGDNGSGSGARS